MRQVVQPLSGGPVEVIDVPAPVAGPSEVLVLPLVSVISSGTERSVTALAQSTLLAKARARPDLVRQVMARARRDGLGATVQVVRARLAGDIALGYSAAGVVLEVGEHVSGIAAGQLVATGGAGKANHAELQAVPGLLCVPLPDGVGAADGAFATIGAVALHALRLAEVSAGSKVIVIGLGLVGQLAMRIAAAGGCDVAGIDVRDSAVERARRAGMTAWIDGGAYTTDAVIEWSRQRGADGVLIASSGGASSVIQRAPELCRDRATIVVVGDVGLEMDRRSLYEKELTVRVARSYGPGRYERSYEEWAVDMPIGHVRWSEGRNMEAVVDLLSSGRLQVVDLVTHSFPIERAAEAYRLVDEGIEPYLAIQLTYKTDSPPAAAVTLRPVEASRGRLGVGLIGAGGFASGVLLPALRRAGFSRLVAVASAGGLSARRLGERMGFERAVSGAPDVYGAADVDVVVIATSHLAHADLASAALRAGKHVYCEKPLALTEIELADVEAAWRDSGRVLFVGFNRRWSKAVRLVKEHFEGGSGPLVLSYRISAGTLPPSHWYHDRRQGGRLIGEVCHFVDTCSAIVGSEPVAVQCSGSHRVEVALEDNLVLTVRYANGSVAVITYASGGHESTEKERLEVLGRGGTAIIEDFTRVTLNGKAVRDQLDGKGHDATAARFAELLLAPDPSVTLSSLRSSAVVIEAAVSLSVS
jgi:predicted dehydrogenase/threonine dehydrogenase-like Zn-dependent dehydrogenase